jgi:uncharacterized protein YlxW (UPF0749 family)
MEMKEDIEMQNVMGSQDRRKKLVISIAVCSLIIISLLIAVCSFLVFSSRSADKIAKVAESANTPIVETTSSSEQALQSQVDSLSNEISNLNKNISQIQSQLNTDEALTTSPADQQTINEVNNLTATETSLGTLVSSLQNQVMGLENQLKGASYTIGTSSTSINGLSVVFITNDIAVGVTGSSTPSVAQFAIKIGNTTGSDLSNIDITGTITSTQDISGSVASGYPQLIDGSGTCSYAYPSGMADTLNFEAYSSGSTGLSIPAGGSITLRPKVSILSMSKLQVPATAFTISLNSITYNTNSTITTSTK